MEAKRIISARYADNDIDIENISSDFSDISQKQIKLQKTQLGCAKWCNRLQTLYNANRKPHGLILVLF